MILNDVFWKNYELDLAEIKVSYLNWAIGYAKGTARAVPAFVSVA